MRSLVAALAALMLVTCWHLADAAQPRHRSDTRVFANTSQAVIQGRLLSLDGIRTTASFFGVPFAKPPVGPLRFAAPQAWTAAAPADASEPLVASLDEVDALEVVEPDIAATGKATLVANVSRPACLQAPGNSASAGAQSEDCLYLNIHSPLTGALDSWSESIRVPRPVVAWLHDGFLETGAVSSADNPLAWDLAAQQRLVLVEVAYRLGVFGFLRLPGDEGGGNWGLVDQQLALGWIHGNIRAFGGDPTLVTLAGVGAGAASAGLHLFSSGSSGLFHRVAMLGGGPLSPWLFASDNAAADGIAGEFLRRAGCQQSANVTDTARCLREANADTFAALQPSPKRPLDIAAFPVVIDGRFITGSPASARPLDAKPSLIGFTDQEGEGALVDRAIGNVTDLAGGTYRAVLDAAFRFYPSYPKLLGAAGRRLLAGSLTAFPSSAAARLNRRLLSQALAQRYTVCPANRFLDALVTAGNGTAPVYAYQFSEPDPSVDAGAEGARHGQDAFYFLGGPVRDKRYSRDQAALSMRMMSTLAAFAATGQAAEDWPRATVDEIEFMHFSAKVVEPRAGGSARQSCLFWDEQLAWVNQLDGGPGATTPSPGGELEFWARCNRSVNIISVAAIATGGAVCMILTFLLVAVACLKRRRRPRRSGGPQGGAAAHEAVEMQPQQPRQPQHQPQQQPHAGSRYTVAPVPKARRSQIVDKSRPGRKPRE